MWGGPNPYFSQLISRRGAGTLACRVETTRLDTLSGCETVSNQERPHEWGRGRQECLRHELAHRRLSEMQAKKYAALGNIACPTPYWMATVTGVLAAPAAVTTTGTLGPGVTPGGTSTFT